MPVCKYGVDNEDMPVGVWCRYRYARCCHVPMSPTTYYTTSYSSPIRREDIRPDRDSDTELTITVIIVIVSSPLDPE